MRHRALSLQQVHLRINDAATGKPTPVRLRITGADGAYFAPFGRLTEFATGVNQDVGGNVMIGAKRWAYIDGTCEILLPPGELHVEISKGPEFKPIDEKVTLLAGKMSLRFTIERWIDMRKLGWHSGDTRVHYLSPDAALLEGQAEDVAVVNLLVRETSIIDSFGKTQRAVPIILSFSGQSFARSSEQCGVAVNTQNVHPQLGSLGLLHCHRVVYPLAFGDEEWTLHDWCGQCHRKKGLVVWTEPQHQTSDFLYGEPLADLILGGIDAFELSFYEDSPFDALADYYRILNAGLSPALAGASGKSSNGEYLGSMRTFAWLGSDECAYTNWIDAVRAGQTFVTNGPLIDMTINGERNFGRCDASALRIRAAVKSMRPIDHIELIWNGELVATAPFDTGTMEGVLEHEFTPTTSGWFAMRCRGDALVASRPAPQRLFAHTSPVVVDNPGKANPKAAGARAELKKELENMKRWAEKKKMPRLLHVIGEAIAALSVNPQSAI
jgi:hypothetical protein